LITPLEIARRVAGRWTGRIHTLPILALSVHSACNCRCVMCDIWKANHDKRELSADSLEQHVAAIRRLRVRRVMLTGGEPLLHSNLWALCERLRAEDIRLTLVTTGLTIASHADRIASLIDDVVISVDGAPDTHDTIRRVRGGFDRIGTGVRALRANRSCPSLTARSVIQKANCLQLEETIRAVQGLEVDRLSFLGADVSSTAFNRPVPWAADRRAEIALSRDELPDFAAVVAHAERSCRDLFARGFIQGGAASLWRIHDYYAALAGLGPWPDVRCNAPLVSAVLETDGQVRPCFFHPAYGTVNRNDLESVINSPAAIAFRRTLDVTRNETCRRCVCSLSLPLIRE